MRLMFSEFVIKMNDAINFPSLPAMADSTADQAAIVVPVGVLLDLGPTSENPSLTDGGAQTPVGVSYSGAVQQGSPVVQAVLTPVVVGNVQEAFPELGSGSADIRAYFPRSPKGLRKFQPVLAGENPIPAVGVSTGHLLDSPVRCPSRPLSPKPATPRFDMESHSLVTLQAAAEFDPLKNREGGTAEAVACMVVIPGPKTAPDNYLDEVESSSSDESVLTVNSVQTKTTKLGGENRS
jgi:hypothetical protein